MILMLLLLEVLENQPVGSVGGQLTTQDPDAITVFTHTLVGGSNDNHSPSMLMGLFEQLGFRLRIQLKFSSGKGGISNLFARKTLQWKCSIKSRIWMGMEWRIILIRTTMGMGSPMPRKSPMVRIHLIPVQWLMQHLIPLCY